MSAKDDEPAEMEFFAGCGFRALGGAHEHESGVSHDGQGKRGK